MPLKERTRPALRGGHPQNVAYPQTAEEAEESDDSGPETELYSVASLEEAANPEPSLTQR